MLTGVQIGPEIGLLDDEEEEELDDPPLDEDELETPDEELVLLDEDELEVAPLLDELLLDELDEELLDELPIAELLEELLLDELDELLLLNELLEDELLDDELGGKPPEEELLLDELDEELKPEELEDIAVKLPSDEFSIQARNTQSNRTYRWKTQ